eukprot:scaffold200894_cov15-Tisochrysis_lutea.AAC.2
MCDVHHFPGGRLHNIAGYAPSRASFSNLTIPTLNTYGKAHSLKTEYPVLAPLRQIPRRVDGMAQFVHLTNC